MKKNHVLLIAALAMTACSKKEPIQVAEPHVAQTKNKATVTADNLIALCNNQNNNIDVYDIAVSDWNSPSARVMSWDPEGEGYTTSEINLWNNGDPEGDPMDVKMRATSVWGTSFVFVAVGGQLATIVNLSTGDKLWARDVGAGAYPHAIELLPNGNVAVAASHGDWVRIYNTSAGATNYYQYSLIGAHGVLWDPQNSKLWAIGDTKIISFNVGASRTSPTLTVATTTTIPGNGHDLYPFYGNTNKIWYTNTGGVYTFDKTTLTSTAVSGAAFRSAVKSIGNQPTSGNIVEVKPNSVCTLNTWCTPYVDFYNSSGAFLYYQNVVGAAIYKARIWNSSYQ